MLQGRGFYLVIMLACDHCKDKITAFHQTKAERSENIFKKSGLMDDGRSVTIKLRFRKPPWFGPQQSFKMYRSEKCLG